MARIPNPLLRPQQSSLCEGEARVYAIDGEKTLDLINLYNDKPATLSPRIPTS
jgi:hypothetical protein